MSTLKFFARDGHILAWPGQNVSGGSRRYIGRDTNVIQKDGETVDILHPAQEKPVEIESSSEAGQRILRLFRIEDEAPLWPADEATAKACGVPFVSVKFDQMRKEFYVAGHEAASPKKKGDQ